MTPLRLITNLGLIRLLSISFLFFSKTETFRNFSLLGIIILIIGFIHGSFFLTFLRIIIEYFNYKTSYINIKSNDEDDVDNDFIDNNRL